MAGACWGQVDDPRDGAARQLVKTRTVGTKVATQDDLYRLYPALTALTGVLCLSSKNKNKAVKAVSQSQRMLRFKLAIWKAPLPIFRREDQSVFSEVEILIVESLIGIQ